MLFPIIFPVNESVPPPLRSRLGDKGYSVSLTIRFPFKRLTTETSTEPPPSVPEPVRFGVSPHPHTTTTSLSVQVISDEASDYDDNAYNIIYYYVGACAHTGA